MLVCRTQLFYNYNNNYKKCWFAELNFLCWFTELNFFIIIKNLY